MRQAVRVVVGVAVASMALTAGGGCTRGEGGGEGKTLVVSSDLPLQGTSQDVSDSTNKAIQLYLDQIGNAAGDFTIEFKPYDDSTQASGTWDEGTCAKNANDHVANADEIAVMGTYNSECAKIAAPVLNQDPNGPMLMVSHANTNPGLTKEAEPGEPERYFPTGRRNYARVIATDDYQGTAAAQFASGKLGVAKVYVLHDGQTYGRGLAQAFVEEAKRVGIEVLGSEPWDAGQTSYSALFTKIKELSPDLVYVAGIYDNNGGQLIKDKVATLGGNTAVKLIGPDGFTGYSELQELPQGEGMYLTFTGLSRDQLASRGGAAAKLLEDYEDKYGEPASSYALYGVAAMQVILAAIERSDGTRKSVVDAVFEGDGITIPADESVIGTEIRIDPISGDTSAREITVLTLQGGVEALVEVVPVS